MKKLLIRAWTSRLLFTVGLTIASCSAALAQENYQVTATPPTLNLAAPGSGGYQQSFSSGFEYYLGGGILVQPEDGAGHPVSSLFPFPVTCSNCSGGGGGGGGGAITAAANAYAVGSLPDGAITSMGSKTDAAWNGSAGSASLIAINKQIEGVLALINVGQPAINGDGGALAHVTNTVTVAGTYNPTLNGDGGAPSHVTNTVTVAGTYVPTLNGDGGAPSHITNTVISTSPSTAAQAGGADSNFDQIGGINGSGVAVPNLLGTMVFTSLVTAAGNTVVIPAVPGKRFFVTGIIATLESNSAQATQSALTFSLQDGSAAILVNKNYIPASPLNSVEGAINVFPPITGIEYISSAVNQAATMNLSAALTAGGVSITLIGGYTTATP